MKKGVNMVWFDKEVLNAAKKILRNASLEIAEKVRDDAIKTVIANAANSTEMGLAEQFDIIPSKYDETSFLVWCQGPRKWWPPFHASFVELGAYSSEWGRYKKGEKKGAYIAKKPFLRVAAHKQKRNATRTYQKHLDKGLQEPKWDEPKGDFLDDLLWGH